MKDDTLPSYGKVGDEDARMADLFFRVLFRLGALNADWNAWYGTRRKIGTGAGLHSPAARHPIFPTPIR